MCIQRFFPWGGIMSRILVSRHSSKEDAPERFLAGLGENGLHVGEHPLEGLFGGVGALAGSSAVELFGGGEQGPSPSVFMSVFVDGINEVFSHDIAPHLHPSDDGIETATHLWTRKATEGAKLTSDETAMLVQCGKYRFLDRSSRWCWILMTAIIAKVGPPSTTDKTSLLIEELAIHTIAIRYDGAFPLPQRPVPPPVREDGVSAIIGDHLFGGVAGDAAVEQGQESHLLDALDELGGVVDVGGGHNWK